jgi:hypothetical protein
MKRKIAAVITDILGDRVIIGEDELQIHLQKHFAGIPRDLILELIERILKDPSIIYEEVNTHTYHLFYRLETGHFVVVIVKKQKEGTFFSAIYSTGKFIRNKHKKLKRVKL